jgi:hypothetical protein
MQSHDGMAGFLEQQTFQLDHRRIVFDQQKFERVAVLSSMFSGLRCMVQVRRSASMPFTRPYHRK